MVPTPLYPEKRAFKRIIILGHTGFIGAAIMDKLTEKGKGLEICGFSSKTVDLVRWEQVVQLAPFFDAQTAVIMCSAIKRHIEDSLGAFQKNMQMVCNLIRLLRQNPVGKFVFFSSPAVYGEDRDDLHINEETPVHPVSFYGSAKYASESLLNVEATQNSDLSLLILRPSLVYGVGDDKEFYRPGAFARDILTSGHITLWGDGTELRDFIALEDVAELTWQLLSCNSSGTFNLTSGEVHSFIEVLNIYKESGLANFVIHSRPRTRTMVHQGFVNAKLRSVIPAYETTSFKHGILSTFHQVRSRFA